MVGSDDRIDGCGFVHPFSIEDVESFVEGFGIDYGSRSPIMSPNLNIRHWQNLFKKTQLHQEQLPMSVSHHHREIQFLLSVIILLSLFRRHWYSEPVLRTSRSRSLSVASRVSGTYILGQQLSTVGLLLLLNIVL